MFCGVKSDSVVSAFDKSEGKRCILKRIAHSKPEAYATYGKYLLNIPSTGPRCPQYPVEEWSGKSFGSVKVL
ncbi:hypothetical protein TcWFU_006627 [Taenia crassiceps]|uniref:Uncharacterized protein n=1 Tax=Taenia crassiceps TaxID=6207 RepID=A0ABR4Q6J5_9CEST